MKDGYYWVKIGKHWTIANIDTWDGETTVNVTGNEESFDIKKIVVGDYIETPDKYKQQKDGN